MLFGDRWGLRNERGALLCLTFGTRASARAYARERFEYWRALGVNARYTVVDFTVRYRYAR